MPAPPFLIADMDSVGASLSSTTGDPQDILSSSAWLDDVVLHLIPVTEEARCVLRLRTDKEFFSIVRLFGYGWQSIASHARSVPPSQSTLDLFLAQWSSTLSLLVSYVACSSTPQNLLLYHITLAEMLRDALMAIFSRMELMVPSSCTSPHDLSFNLPPPLEWNLVVSLLQNIVRTVVGYYNSDVEDVLDDSLFVPPYAYVHALKMLAAILRPMFAIILSTDSAAGELLCPRSEDCDVCSTLDNHFLMVVSSHTRNLLHTVVFPALYSERWTTSAAKYFGGREISHSISFFLGLIVTRGQRFLNTVDAKGTEVGNRCNDHHIVAVAQDVLFISLSMFLDEYFRFLLHVGGEDGDPCDAQRQLTPNRKSQLVVDILFIVLRCRWMLLLFRPVDQRPELATKLLRIVAAGGAHAHPADFKQGAELFVLPNEAPSASSEANTQSAADEDGPSVDCFVDTVWNTSPIPGWKDLTRSTPSTLARHTIAAVAEVCLPSPREWIHRIVGEIHGKGQELMQLLSMDEISILLKVCVP